MRIVSLGEPRVIMENPTGRHNYFAWPTVARLKNGRLAVAASGFRMRHICPFGKTVLAFSDDNGETYTAPAPVIDTVLDDRDGGVTPFGESGVVVTSFNHTVEFQRQYAETPYDHAYLDTITPEEEAAALGATFRISHDNGKTFGKEILLDNNTYSEDLGYPSTVELSDGSLFSVYYQKLPDDKFCSILYTKWSLKEVEI
jgi:hypothetical protein